MWIYEVFPHDAGITLSDRAWNLGAREVVNAEDVTRLGLTTLKNEVI